MNSSDDGRTTAARGADSGDPAPLAAPDGLLDARAPAGRGGDPVCPSAWDRIWTDVNLARMTDPGLGILKDGAVAVREGRIAWIGPAAELRDAGVAADVQTAELGDAGAAAAVVRCGGCWLTPGFVDCHAHLVFAGSRADEFRRRLRGESYEEIAQSGGGILSTVRATRAASRAELAESAAERLRDLAAWGVTTSEIKSGYGLDLETELKMLAAAADAGRGLPVDVTPTLLAAHAVPPEYAGRRSAYVHFVVREVLPAAVEQGLAEGVDVFCEKIAFTAGEARRVLEAGIAAGLRGHVHADQLSGGGGGALAAAVGARSADHLEHLSQEGVEAMAERDVSAVLLPGAAHVLGADRAPPVAALREAGVSMAVATDANPGSSPFTHVGAILNLACRLFGLTPEEALLGFTAVAAKVLNLAADRGALEVGKRADFALWKVRDLTELCCWVPGRSPLAALVKDGEPVTPGRFAAAASDEDES